MATHYPSLRSVQTRDLTVGRNVRDGDYIAGQQAARSARLDRGLTSTSPASLIAST